MQKKHLLFIIILLISFLLLNIVGLIISAIGIGIYIWFRKRVSKGALLLALNKAMDNPWESIEVETASFNETLSALKDEDLAPEKVGEDEYIILLTEYIRIRIQKRQDQMVLICEELPIHYDFVDQTTYAGGNGDSYEEAVIILCTDPIKGVEYEYEWIQKFRPLHKMLSQELRFHDEIPYDVIKLKLENGQNEREIYFDISSFYK